MWQFLLGFVVALSAVAPVLYLWARRRVPPPPQSDDGDTGQIEELSRLTGALAHEIKNPLSTIKVNLRLVAEELERLESARTDREKRDHRITRALRKIAVIEKESARLEQILSDFMGYTDRGPPQFEDVDINELISDMVDFYTPQAFSHSITMRHTLHKEPLVCKVDADMLKQVILNLFINAQQAMEGGGELMVRTAKDGPNAVVQVSDTGKGIPPDKLEHIFDAYYSLRPQGTGLGLPTTRKIIEAHNGTITAQSTPGKGASFSIRLPLVHN